MKTHVRKSLKAIATLKISIFLVASIGCLVFLSCYSTTTFQTPEVTEPGKASARIGAALPFEGDIILRIGIVKNLDVGGKIGLGMWGGMGGDMKYQFLRKPFPASASLGFSYGQMNDMPDSGDDFDYIAWYPLIIFGNKNIFSGIKAIYVTEKRTSVYSTDKTETFFLPGAIIGFSIGRTLRIGPEANIYIRSSDHRFLYSGGVAIYRDF